MKKLSIFLLALTLSFSLNTFAQESQQATIRVDASANSEVMPDTVTIRFYVENSGTNLNEIKEKNDKTVNEATSKIKAKLANNESIKTVSFRVNSIYSYKNQSRLFQKYEVTNGFEVKLKDIAKISEIIKIAMDSGVKRVDQLNFSVENGEDICNGLITNAVSIARKRAQAVATASGSSLSKVKEINPYCSLNSNFVQPRLLNTSMKAMSAGSATSDSVLETIEPGTINARANVNMVYYLK